jgi:hypothetical protein
LERLAGLTSGDMEGYMTRKEAIEKTIFKYKWIKDNLDKYKYNMPELNNFYIAYPEYQKYYNECPLCELFCAGSWDDPDCPECILNVDNCYNETGRFQKFIEEKSIPGKRKFCNWIIKKCEKALEVL